MSEMERRNRPLEKMFNDVPQTYDLMNRLLTLGLDRRWRNRAATLLVEKRPTSILDLCTGTGDFALSVARLCGPDVRVVGLDFSRPMLERAEEKRDRAGLEWIEFIEGDASALPFRTDEFDAVGISFAFRNLTYRNPLTAQALAEVRRVLKPEGVFVGVESWQPSAGLVRALRNVYVEVMASRLGGAVSGNKPAYRYLAASIRNFYSPEEIRQMLRASEFETVDTFPLLLGAAGVFVAA